MMQHMLVLGIGSPFDDDQLGWAVIKKLRQSPRLQVFSADQLKLSYVDRPGLRLLTLMQDAHTVFLIDAVKMNSDIGSLHCLQGDVLDNLDWACKVSSSHAIGVAEALKLGRALDLLPQRIALYGIEIGSVCPQKFELSSVILKAVDQLFLRVERDVLATCF